jgi:hypothetical protein
MKQRGQVWIETVLYTFIGLTLLGLVLGFVYPRVQAAQERALLQQTTLSLSGLDDIIQTVTTRGPGNVKKISFSLQRGTLTVNPSEETISLSIDELHVPPSEPGVAIPFGNSIMRTLPSGERYKVQYSLQYTILDLSVTGEQVQTFQASSVPYQFLISNEGGTGKPRITLSLQ